MAGCFAPRGLVVYVHSVDDNRSSGIIDLGEGEMVRSKTAADERKRRDAEKELRELERRSDQEQRKVETTLAAIDASIARGNSKWKRRKRPPPGGRIGTAVRAF
jgi:hypothetical protein